MERFMMKQAADVINIVTHKRHGNKSAVCPSNECPYRASLSLNIMSVASNVYCSLTVHFDSVST